MGTSPVGTRSLTLLVNGSEYRAEVSAVRITQRKAEEVGLFSPPEGDVEYVLKATAVQDVADPSSLWRAVWDNPNSLADVEVHPYGSAYEEGTNYYARPYFAGTVRLQPADGDAFGGDASASLSSRFKFEIEWPFVAKSTLVTPWE